MIYFDNNATTPVDPEVSDAVFSTLKREYGNPSSSHAIGARARELVRIARDAVAAFVGCSGDEVLFTSGGTESNNLAIIGTAGLHGSGHIITSAIEHPSVENPCRHLESRGFDVTYVPVDSQGMVEPDTVRKSIRKQTILISIMHANNETGVIQPVEEIGALAREHGVPFHVDAAQSLGKMHFSLSGVPVDLLTVVPHKFYGPKGVGALYVRKGLKLSPVLIGGGQESGIRPGTENVPGIVGFGKTCQIATRDIKLRVSHTHHLRDLLFDLTSRRIPDARLNGHATRRLPNTLNLVVPGTKGQDLVERVRDRLAISAGAACHAEVHSPSRVLKHMGLSDEEALSSIRMSLGKDNTDEEVRLAVEILAGAVETLRKEGAVSGAV